MTPPNSGLLLERAFQSYLDGRASASGGDIEAFLAGQPSELRDELRRTIADYHRLQGSVIALPKLERGRVLGDFLLLEELGSGGMGVVWAAKQTSLRRRVALKVLAPHLSLSREHQQRFQREAEASGRMAHPGIVQVYAVGEVDGLHYIAQELVAGGFTLADRLAELRDLSLLPADHHRRLAELFARVADALHEAHEAGVIHRDVKPANILITDENQPKLTDFGLALVQDALGLSRSGALMGTPHYMSPEQALSRRIGIDRRTDVFSLGATLYEALSFVRAFDGDTYQQVLEKIALVDPPDPRTLRSRVPPELAVICMKALEKRRERRYTTMAELADDLRRFRDGQPIHARPPSALARARGWLRRHPVLGASGAVAAVALCAITALFVHARRQSAFAHRSALAEAERRAEAENSGYVAGLSAARAALNDGRVADAKRFHAECPPAERGWEWYHLGLEIDSTLVTIQSGLVDLEHLRFTPAGELLCIGTRVTEESHASTIGVWDAETGELLRSLELESEDDWIWDASPDGCRVLVEAASGAVQVLDTTTMQLEAELDCGGELESASFTQDGAWLSTRTSDRALLHEVATWRSLLLPFVGVVDTIAPGSEAGTLLVLYSEGPLCLLDAVTGAIVPTLWSVDGTSYKPGGPFMPRTFDGGLGVWNALTGALVAKVSLPEGASVDLMTPSADGRLLALVLYTAESRSLEVRELATWSPVTRIPARANGASPRALSLQADGSRLAVLYDDERVHVLETATGATVADLPGSLTLNEGETTSFYDLTLSPDGATLAAPCDDGRIRLLRLSEGSVAQELAAETGEKLVAMAFRSDGLELVAAIEDGGICSFDTAGREIWRNAFIDLDARFVGLSADGSRAFAIDDDGARVVVERTTPNQILRYGSPRLAWEATDLLRDGSRALTVDYADSIVVWDPRDGRIATHLESDTRARSGTLGSRGDRCLVDGDRGIELWNVQLARRIKELEDARTPLRWSPDGASLATGTRHGRSVVVWDAVTGLRRSSFPIEGWLREISFSANGELLAAAASDGVIRAWDAHSLPHGQQISLSAMASGVHGMDFGEGGDLFAVAYGESTMRHGLGVLRPVGMQPRCDLADTPTAALSMHLLEQGMVLTCIDANGTALAWDTTTGGLLGILPDEECQARMDAVAEVERSGVFGRGEAHRGSDDYSLRTLLSESGLVSAAGHAPSATLALAFQDGRVVLQDVKSNERRELRGKCLGETPLKLAFRGDRSELLAMSKSGRFLVWGCDTGQLRADIDTGIVGVSTFLLLPSEGTLAIGSDQGDVILWSIAEQTSLARLPGHQAEISTLLDAVSETRLLSASLDGSLRLWNVAERTCVATMSCEGEPVLDAVASTDGVRLLTRHLSSTVRIWDLPGGTVRARLNHADGLVLAASMDPDGAAAVTSTQAGTLRLWDLESGTCTERSAIHQGKAVRCWSSKAFRAASACGTVDEGSGGWGINPFQPELPHSTPLGNSGRLALSSLDGSLRIWTPRTAEVVVLSPGGSAPILALAADEGGGLLVSADADGEVRFWEADSGRCRDILQAHDSGISRIEVAARGHRLATVARSGELRLWDTRTMARLASLVAEDERGRVLAFDPTGRYLAGANAKDLRIWDAETGALRATVPHASGNLFNTGLAFSPDGKTLAVAVGESVLLVDPESGRELGFLKTTDRGLLTAVAFDPVHGRLYAGGWDSVAIFFSALDDARAYGREREGIHRRILEATKGLGLEPGLRGDVDPWGSELSSWAGNVVSPRNPTEHTAAERERALRLAELSVALNPLLGERRNTLAWALLANGRQEEALKQARIARPSYDGWDGYSEMLKVIAERESVWRAGSR